MNAINYKHLREMNDVVIRHRRCVYTFSAKMIAMSGMNDVDWVLTSSVGNESMNWQHYAVGNFPWDSDKHRRLSLAQAFFYSLCCVALLFTVIPSWFGMLHHRVTAMFDSFSIRRNALSRKYGEVARCTRAHKSWYVLSEVI